MRAAHAAGQPDVARKHATALVALMDPASSRPELSEAGKLLAER
jgi:hypothetical protein